MLKKKFKSIIKSGMNRLPYVKTLHRLNTNSRFPAGHFYSSVVSLEEIREKQDQIWPLDLPVSLTGIDLKTEEQLRLLKVFKSFYEDFPFPVDKEKKIRYFLNNPFFSFGDGFILFSMIKYFQPKRIIEIGSGFSSALMMDTNDLFFDSEIQLTFVEPFPGNRLNHLIGKAEENIQLIEEEVQTVNPDLFKSLEAGDILFVDSSHVVKTGSDVHFILKKVLPILKKGVLIHFHDIHFPFEYPKDWVLNGFGWNEVYYIHAFLMYNEQFRIRMFNDFLSKCHSEKMNSIPLMQVGPGSSLWLEKMN